MIYLDEILTLRNPCAANVVTMLEMELGSLSISMVGEEIIFYLFSVCSWNLTILSTGVYTKQDYN